MANSHHVLPARREREISDLQDVIIAVFTTAVLFVGSMAIAGSMAFAAEITDKSFTDDDLFRQTRIWRVDLTFTPDNWALLPPRNTGARGPGFLLAAPGTRNGLMGQSGFVFDWVHADLKIDAAEFPDIGVRNKGNDTYRAAAATTGKISFKLDLNKYVKGQKLAKLDKLNLHNEIEDTSYISESISYQLFRSAGVPAPRSAWAQVYITIAGQQPRKYRGLYSLIEDVDSVFSRKWFGSSDGALLKPVTRTPFTYLGDDWSRYKLIYDPKADLTADQQRRIIDFCRLVSNAEDGEFNAKLGDFVDLDEFARFMAILVWEVDTDSILQLGQNYYVWLDPKTNKLSFIPWDQDQTFDHVSGRMIDMSVIHPWGGNNPFLERVFANTVFREMYLKRLAEYSDTFLRPESIAAQVDRVAAAIRGAVKEESADGLAQFDKAIAGTEQFSRGGRGGNIQPIKSFAKERARIVAEQLRASGR
jgi:spore coat protein CotH